MEKSSIFNFFCEETSPASGKKYPSADELAKRFQSRRKQPNKKSEKTKKEREAGNKKSKPIRKSLKSSIRALLKQKAVSSLVDLDHGKSSQHPDNPTSTEANPIQDCHSKTKAATHPVHDGKSDSKNRQSKKTITTKYNKNLVISKTSGSANKVIVVEEWDGRSNSFCMNLNVNVQARN